MRAEKREFSSALHERLAGLPDLATARARLEDWGRPLANDHNFSVHAMLVGLQRFDTVNLAYGARAGDVALDEMAFRIQHFASDELDGQFLLAHAGGGKFLLVSNEPCSRERWQLVAEQIAELIASPIVVPDGVLRLSPRVALLRGLEGETGQSVMDRLGQALDEAMRQQGNRIAWATGEQTPPGYTSAELEAALMSAIDNDEIEVLFQPQFSLPDDKLTGAEALARWNHPQLGRMGAGSLFTIAERADFVPPLSRHIAARALDIASGWPAHLRLSLNVTPADLAYGTYVRHLLELVKETGFPLRRLTLEVTEQALVHDVHQAAQMMAELSAQGIAIALDDFGAGFCNFRYLKILPLHYLKLDRAMVDGITTDARDLAVLRGIVAMADALDLQVIAEGIETEEQRNCIEAEGCAFYQGFLRAQPVSAALFAKLFA